MDPRQPQQHPYARNTVSPYGRSPFPPSSNQPPPFSAASHPPDAAPSYAEHQRRPSDPPYGGQQRSYASEGPPMSGSSHSRHQSASSIGYGTPVGRGMPPPSSPQQQTPHGFGAPPPRAPPLSSGQSSAFTSGRELPSLNSLSRAPSAAGSSMSISSMLGGPPPSTRDQAPAQYTSPVTTSAQQYSGTAHASPRTNTTGPDYAPFRRPQTPEHPRAYETSDHRANSAGSPTRVGSFSTPDGRRYGTPHAGYTQRQPDDRREPIRVANPNIPPRPNSQPSSYSAQPSRAPDRVPAHTEGLFGRREPPRPEPRQDPAYHRQAEYEERQNAMYAYEQRVRQDREREALLQREMRDREQREQADRERERERAINERSSNLQQEYAHQLAQRNPQSAYNRPPDHSREQPLWMRPGYEPPRPAYEPIPPEDHREPSRQPNNSHGYPSTIGPQYGGQPAYAPGESRYPTSQASSMPAHNSTTVSQHEASMQERQERARQRVTTNEQQRQQQAIYGGGPSAGPYHPQESPSRRAVEDSQQMQQQRSFLGVQEINRKGRASPLPQAVQGAQGQLTGPGHEPGIKHEFGKIYGGIGSGVGSMGAPSPVTVGPQGITLSNPGQIRREDMDQDSPMGNGAGIQSTVPRGVRRRKLREEDSSRDEDINHDSNNPNGTAKRSKPHHHHHHHHHHHPDEALSQNPTPFKSARGGIDTLQSGPETKGTPVLHHHHAPRQHHHHHHHGAPSKPAPVLNTIIPLPKRIIRSQEVLNAVAHKPREHLGYGYYRATLTPARRATVDKDDRGFASTPEPLPRFEGHENSTFTIKVPRVYLEEGSREEITARRAIYGTDVYTDDSDVIGACIHQGWFRGAWNKGVDVELLGLELSAPTNGAVKGKDCERDILTEPPATGPMHVPDKKDLHVTVLILSPLEKYSSMTRFGMKSREWGGVHEGYKGVHDGMSFMIMSIKWVDGVDGNEARNGASRRKLLAEELDETEMEVEKAWGKSFFKNKGTNGEEPHAEESFARGEEPVDGVEMTGDIKGVGTKSWWLKPNKVSKIKKAGEKVIPQGKAEMEADKDREIEQVTERMIENANASSATDTMMTDGVEKPANGVGVDEAAASTM